MIKERERQEQNTLHCFSVSFYITQVYIFFFKIKKKQNPKLEKKGEKKAITTNQNSKKKSKESFKLFGTNIYIFFKVTFFLF